MGFSLLPLPGSKKGMSVFALLMLLLFSNIVNATCITKFELISLVEQLQCLKSIEQTGKIDEKVKIELTELFNNSDGQTDHRIIAFALDVVRSFGNKGNDLAEPLSSLLLHQSKLYHGRDKWHVLRLRAYIFLTLSEIGYPDSAIPMLIDTVAHFDNRMMAVEMGSAIRAIGSLGTRGRNLSGYLLNAIGDPVSEEEFSLHQYDVAFHRKDATTIQIEAVRALRSIEATDNKQVMIWLANISKAGKHSGLDLRLINEAKKALASFAALKSSKNNPQFISTASVSPWLNREKRQPSNILDFIFTDQNDKNKAFRQIVDKPVFLIFFYTRCQNSGKCAMTIAKLASLQKQLKKKGLSRSIRLVAITYEPQFDNALRLQRYVTIRGLKLNDHVLTARLDLSLHSKFVEELQNPVGFNAGWVNSHGVEATLLDRQGRVVRKYPTQFWKNATIIADLQHLLVES